MTHVRTRRTRFIAILAILPLILGVLVPSLALGCANVEGAAAACVCCPDGIVAASGACGTICQSGPTASALAPHPDRTTTPAWFAAIDRHLAGIDNVPEPPPPR